ncbi:DUF3017 domain-containing protein [Propionibacteriaceae bacterium Y2011]|uniref:DUF3017 domain-containing protein n=1 Tax=Microlunatus sp. Y2014 TaxID=3418488 RepID=UPI003B451353
MTTTTARVGRRPVVQWPLLLVLAGVCVGEFLALTGTWRPGAVVIGLSVGLGALARLLLPDRMSGLLQVRSRTFDVAALTILAVGIVLIAVVVPDAPGQ